MSSSISSNRVHNPQLAASSEAAVRRSTQNNENDYSNSPPAAAAASVPVPPPLLLSPPQHENDDSNGPPAAAAASVPAPTPPLAASAATSSLENVPGDDDDDAPVPPAQTAAAYEEMEDAIKESIKITQSDDDAPLPPTQIAAAYEEIDSAMNGATKTAKRKPELIEDDDAPLPAAMKSEEIVDVNESSYENDGPKKPPASLANRRLWQGQDDAAVPLSSPVPQVGHGQVLRPPPRSILVPNRNESRTSSAPTESRTSRTNQIMQAARAILRPPPQTMLPRNNDSDNTSSAPMLEATLVQGVEATLIVPNNEPDIPIYNAVQV
eukprot:CAMPEP_0201903240 /NCGR_PEP_ID=MMETSP0902-20130614/55373_1 /ASSEMBLY_ACC=CAM_ASM_000551 /TAXON_ID=420261 /ORGANISM="Thalassiosira antarctica, Strain CCMP982" /LENGTH=322 /DNA_ID=CAMNT_0048437277 /DNA_START=268 /DNA_END=1233 /DNA_ORIENTATION=-